MATVDYFKETYTDTGAKTMNVVNKNHAVTAIIAAGGSDDLDLELQLITGGTRHIRLEATNGTTVTEISGPIVGIGVDITTNTSGSIILEILTTHR